MVKKDDVKGLQKSLRLYYPVDTSSADSIYNSVGSAIGPFMGDAQYNDNTPNNQMTKDCKIMTDTSIEDPLDRLTKYIINANDLTSNQYLNNDIMDYLQLIQNTDWSSDWVASRLWQWQTCMEFGYYQGLCRSTRKSFEQ